MTGKTGKEKKTKKEAEETDTAESDLVAQLANAVVKDEKRRVKDGVKARRKGKTKKKISELLISVTGWVTLTPPPLSLSLSLSTVRRTIGRPEELAQIESLLESQGR